MSIPDKNEIKGKLLQGPFAQNSPSAARLSDPIADTPMVVTLDQLRAYEHNPRQMRNPLYDEIKASILERGLDSPPPITRRPGEEHFIIRNGGNTRLAILNELWNETRDERFFRIHCLFRPWDADRGEIIALTGHLAENDMHGSLSFIERALGVEKARELYEHEQADGNPISQRELARRLKADGYPVSQSHISRMQDTIRYLLPVIPNRLYRGMGKHQIERLLALRNAADKTWAFHVSMKEEAGEVVLADFDTVFAEAVSLRDASDDDEFKTDALRYDIADAMSRELGQTQSTLLMDMSDLTRLQQLHERDLEQSTDQPAVAANVPAAAAETGDEAAAPAPALGEPGEPTDRESREPRTQPQTAQTDNATLPPAPTGQDSPQAEPSDGVNSDEHPDADDALEILEPDALSEEEYQAVEAMYTVTPTRLSDRVRRMKQQIAQATGEPILDWRHSMLHSIPVAAGGLHPISDLWYIEVAEDDSPILRQQIHAMAVEVLGSVGLPQQVIPPSPVGLGFECDVLLLKKLLETAVEEGVPAEEMPSPVAETAFWLLHALSGQYRVLARMAREAKMEAGLEQAEIDEELAQIEGALNVGLGQLLIGTPIGYESHYQPDTRDRLCDAALVKLFRIIRLARHLIDLDLKSEGQSLTAGEMEDSDADTADTE